MYYKFQNIANLSNYIYDFNTFLKPRAANNGLQLPRIIALHRILVRSKYRNTLSQELSYFSSRR